MKITSTLNKKYWWFNSQKFFLTKTLNSLLNNLKSNQTLGVDVRLPRNVAIGQGESLSKAVSKE